MSNSFDLSAEEQQKNIREFIETHGSEGFFVLYFRQLFYRYVKQELKSSADEIDGVGQQLYFDEEGDELLRTYREELLEQCEKRARELVDNLATDSELGRVIADGNIEEFDEFEEQFREAVHSKFEDWEEQGIELVEEVEDEAEESE